MGGMGGGQPPPGGGQPAALTAKPKDVWQSLEALLGKVSNSPPPKPIQQEKPKPQLNFMKGVPGF
jgi:hypothetical protein